MDDTDKVAQDDAQPFNLGQGPAHYVNQTYFTGVQGGVRMTFMEKIGNNAPMFRTAVMMSLEDMMAVRDAINAIEKRLIGAKLAVQPESAVQQ